MKVALLLLTAAVGSFGCSDNDLSLSITSMGVATQATMCAVSPGGGTTIVRGRLDVARATAVGQGYLAAPIVHNGLSSRIQTGGVEYNAIQLAGMNVELQTPAGAAILVGGQKVFFVASAAGRLDPLASASMPGEIIPISAATGLVGQTVIAILRPVGDRAGGQVIGGPINFPIDICTGCLGPVPACPFAANAMVRSAGCSPQQDDPGDCCADSSGFIKCGTSAPRATM
jgi:hypothetical protein